MQNKSNKMNNIVVVFMKVLVMIVALCATIIINSSSSSDGVHGQSLIDLQNGQSYLFTTTCNDYSYYKFTVTQHCVDLNINLQTVDGQPNIYVSKTIPNPTLDNLTWTDYEWDIDTSYVIYANDPNFIIGTYYIGILGYCGNDVNSKFTSAKYYLNVSMIPSTLPGATIVSDITGNLLQSVSIGANSYNYYMFCVATCSDITINFDSFAVTGTPYVDAFISPLLPFASNLDFTWKMTQQASGTLTILGTDPAFKLGPYFISVLGQCMPGSGSCTGLTYDLQVQSVAAGSCVPSTVSPPASPNVLTLGNTISGSITCQTYLYYSVDFTSNVCEDLTVTVTPGSTSYINTFVTKSPSNNPLASNINWGIYGSSSKYGVIMSDGDIEYVNGVYYIAVFADCVSSSNATFQIVAASTLSPNLLGAGIQKDQIVPANGYTRYEFCIPKSGVDVTVNLVGILNNKKHPKTYTWPEMLVSKDQEFVTIYSYTWKLAQIQRRYIFLGKDDIEAGPGHYYISIFGWCTPAVDCPNPKDCGPCENYADSPYSIEVYYGLPPNAAGIATPSSMMLFALVFALSAFFFA